MPFQKRSVFRKYITYMPAIASSHITMNEIVFLKEML